MKSINLDLSAKDIKSSIDKYVEIIHGIENSIMSKDDFLNHFDIFFQKIEDIPSEIRSNLPNSYIDFVEKYGIFSIGNPVPNWWNAEPKMLQPKEIKSALDNLKEEMECETAQEVADNLGLRKKYIENLDNILLFMDVAQNEDFMGFDKRTLNKDTKEMSATLYCPDDDSIEWLAKEKIVKCVTKGFEDVILKILNKKLDYIFKNEINE
jgi:hypothetical protein